MREKTLDRLLARHDRHVEELLQTHDQRWQELLGAHHRRLEEVLGSHDRRWQEFSRELTQENRAWMEARARERDRAMSQHFERHDIEAERRFRLVADQLRDLRDESRSQREALLRMLDRLGPPGPATT